MFRRGILLVLIVFVVVSPLGCSSTPVQDEELSTKYTLYVSLNDKDSYTQLIPTDEAQKMLGDIALKYVEGFTILVGTGAYKDEKGVQTRETSLITEFYFATPEQMQKIMDEVLVKFNQEAVLLEKEQVSAELYMGSP